MPTRSRSPSTVVVVLLSLTSLRRQHPEIWWSIRPRLLLPHSADSTGDRDHHDTNDSTLKISRDPRHSLSIERSLYLIFLQPLILSSPPPPRALLPHHSKHGLYRCLSFSGSVVGPKP
ncbi:hypothetical protein B296_00042654 [Ensete ventricosum]|uniref:Uncharacterized protein n=1 Tax=Ensete ventricosum TaxID=4639 RepID=A0A426YBE2_ENSVE|nr:hypothetical protein B296_00042654 [Ensete ventricosum]